MYYYLRYFIKQICTINQFLHHFLSVDSHSFMQSKVTYQYLWVLFLNYLDSRQKLKIGTVIQYSLWKNLIFCPVKRNMRLAHSVIWEDTHGIATKSASFLPKLVLLCVLLFMWNFYILSHKFSINIKYLVYVLPVLSTLTLSILSCIILFTFMSRN